MSSKIFSIYCIMTDNIEDNGKIIVVAKQKDPRKVEAGRSLAAISKTAKEKEIRERTESERDVALSSEDSCFQMNYGWIVGATGIAIGLGP